METTRTTSVIVPAAGRGTRFGSTENKIWAELRGRTVLSWTLSAFQSHPEIDSIVIAGAREDIPRLQDACSEHSKFLTVVEGGPTRQESVGNALAALPDSCEYVLVHDAARPAVSHELITRILAEARATGAAIPGLPVTDTLKLVDSDGRVAGTVLRSDLRTVQTPQGARVKSLLSAYRMLGPRVQEMTDEAGILEAAGFSVTVIPGLESNIKITSPEDLTRASAILGSEDERATPRTGFGYDVHSFAEGRPLWLGGIQIPHTRGLAGHSDADVLLHAVCDALLGAAGMGDIGVLFPDSDIAHKDRPSIEFLHEIRSRLGAYRVVNVDISLLAEEPRLGPYRSQMVEAISSALGIPGGCVNIKATTSEGLGFVGRREGIACWAVATIVRI